MMVIWVQMWHTILGLLATIVLIFIMIYFISLLGKLYNKSLGDRFLNKDDDIDAGTSVFFALLIVGMISWAVGKLLFG